jgi:hypothetical protein
MVRGDMPNSQLLAFFPFCAPFFGSFLVYSLIGILCFKHILHYMGLEAFTLAKSDKIF